MKRLIKKTITYTLIPNIDEYLEEMYNDAYDFMTPAEMADEDDDLDEILEEKKEELKRNGSISYRGGVWWDRTAVNKYEDKDKLTHGGLI